MEISSLSNAQLLAETKSAAARERDAVLHLLRHLREVERRMLYAEKIPAAPPTAWASWATTAWPPNCVFPQCDCLETYLILHPNSKVVR